jgi:ParB family chromosome partitioning protein
VPCIVVTVGELESSLLALIENLQRRDLDFIEEAQALSRLISTYHLSQEEAARKLGKSQSAVANKLRILRLSPRLLEIIRTQGLSERHARGLLRLPDEASQSLALSRILQEHMTVAKADAMIDQMLASRPKPDEKPRKRTSYIIKDVRLFLNSIDHNMDLLRQSGCNVTCGKEEREDAIYLTIAIPKQKA